MLLMPEQLGRHFVCMYTSLVISFSTVYSWVAVNTSSSSIQCIAEVLHGAEL